MDVHKYNVRIYTQVGHNETYYRNVMLLQQFLLDIRQISSKFFVFQRL